MRHLPLRFVPLPAAQAAALAFTASRPDSAVPANSLLIVDSKPILTLEAFYVGLTATLLSLPPQAGHALMGYFTESDGPQPSNFRPDRRLPSLGPSYRCVPKNF